MLLAVTLDLSSMLELTCVNGENMAKKQFIRWLGYGVSCLTSVLACGPLPDVGEEGYDHSHTTAGTSEGGDPTGSGGGPVGEPGAGGSVSSCQNTAPPQTYLCAGSWYESELAGAAAMHLYTLPANYACQEDPYYGGGDYGSGGVGYGGDGAGGGDYYYYYGGDTSGGDYYAGDGDTSGGDYGDGDGNTSGGDYYGFGGDNTGAGGALPASGGSTSSGNLLSDWCSERDPFELVAGASFAVRPCQLTDLALPIKFTEPNYGSYEVFVYGGSNPCERGTLLATTAGLGTGLTISIPVDTTGVEFVSIEMVTDNNWNSVGLRLVDRPAVGDNSK